MKNLVRSLIEHPAFGRVVLGVIIANAALMGFETSPRIVEQHAGLIHWLNAAVQVIFVVEILLRLIGQRPNPLHFFRDGWNVFDFAVVALSLLPTVGPFATTARLARLLRVARLVSLSPSLRLIINTMLRSIPSMGHVVMLISLLLYIYAIIGVHFFREADPEHWGDMGRALLSLFMVLTLEAWPDLQAAILPTQPYAWIFFASFILLAVFVVINLFIAVIINNLQTVKSEEAQGTSGPLARLEQIKTQVAALEEEIKAIHAARRTGG